MGESRWAYRWAVIVADAVGNAPSGGLRDLAVGFGPLGVTTVTSPAFKVAVTLSITRIRRCYNDCPQYGD